MLPTIRGRSISRNNVKKTTVKAARIALKPESSPSRGADELGYLFHVLLCLLGCLAVPVDPRADRRTSDVPHDRGQRVDEVPDGVDERGDQERDEDDREAGDSEHDDRRRDTTAQLQLSPGKRHEWLEHKRREQREEEHQEGCAHHDECPTDGDEDSGDEHRPDRDRDVEDPP
jgi:hypothetical protein